jgi:hypothetical protein
MFFLWRRLDDDVRQRFWPLYGKLTALMTCGSCFGAVSWSLQMMNISNQFKANYAFSIGDRHQRLSFISIAFSWRSAFVVAYAVEFLCLSAAKLMVLDRMAEFSVPPGESMRERMILGARIVMGVVVFGNVLGLITNIVSSVQFSKAAATAGIASAHYAANNSEFNQEGLKYFDLHRHELEKAMVTLSVQSFCEVAVLLLIVASFFLVGVLCVRRVRSLLHSLDSSSAAASTGRNLHRQVMATTGIVFAAFLLRSAYSAMFAIAWGLSDYGNACPSEDLCDPTCYNVYRLMNRWMFYTPEFQLIIMLISSPITLLVALWGMTSEAALHAMLAGWQKEAFAGDSKLLSVRRAAGAADITLHTISMSNSKKICDTSA